MSADEDAAFRDYFQAIEEEFARRRGRPLMLSPRDVALARAWFEDSLPLAAVLRGFERFFARDAKRRVARRSAPTLAYVEGDVLAAFEDYRSARLGEHQPAGGEARPETAPAAPLVAARARLAAAAEAAARRGEAELARALASAAAAIEVVQPVPRVDAALEDLLERLDGGIADALRAVLSPQETAAAQARAEEDLAAYAGRLKPAAYRALRERAERRHLFAGRGLSCLAGLLG